MWKMLKLKKQTITERDIINALNILWQSPKVVTYREGVTKRHTMIVTLKNLYDEVKKLKQGKPSLKQFKELMWHLFQHQREEYDLSRGSSVNAYVKRYGINIREGIYFYLTVRKG